MDPVQDISQIVSLCISSSLQTSGTTEQKTRTIASQLIENEYSFLRKPMQNTLWTRISRFFRGAFCSKEVKQYKDLKDNLLIIQSLLQKTPSVSFSINKEQYAKLDTLYDGDGREALLAFTERLQEAIQGSFHGDELQKLILNIQAAIPEQVLGCKQSQKELYFQAKQAAQLLNSTTDLSFEEIAEHKKKLVSIRQRVSEEDYPIIREIERAQLRLTTLENKAHNARQYAIATQKVQTLNMHALLSQTKSLLETVEDKDALRSVIQDRLKILLEDSEKKALSLLAELEKAPSAEHPPIAELDAHIKNLEPPNTALDPTIEQFYKEKVKAIEVRLCTRYFEAAGQAIEKHKNSMLLSADLDALITYERILEFQKTLYEQLEHRNEKACHSDATPFNSAWLVGQQTIQNILTKALAEIQARIQMLKPIEPSPTTHPEIPQKEAVIGEKKHLVSDMTQAATGVTLSAIGYYFGAGDTLADLFKVSTVSRTAIAISIALAAHAYEATSQGLPLTYAFGLAAGTIVVPTLASCLSLYGLSLGPVAGCAAVVLGKAPALNALQMHYKTAWLPEYLGSIGTGLRWTLTTGTGGVSGIWNLFKML